VQEMRHNVLQHNKVKLPIDGDQISRNHKSSAGALIQ